ncbi:MAG: HAD-IIIA family hydrolase [Chloroflexales bacterium]
MRAIFLDRDGVINENRADHVAAWEQFLLIPGSLEALAVLTQCGFRIFIVTNQACINRGLVERTTVDAIHRRLAQIAQDHGARIDDVRLCPHRPDEGCRCRKPQPGMLLDLAREHVIDFARTTMIGDALSDIAAGRAVGSQTVLVRSGRGVEQYRMLADGAPQPDYVAADLLAASRWLCDQREIALTLC